MKANKLCGKNNQLQRTQAKKQKQNHRRQGFLSYIMDHGSHNVNKKIEIKRHEKHLKKKMK